MKTAKKAEPGRCSCCEGPRLPLVQSGVWICQNCDGWPPILEPPKPDERPHVQGCGHGKDPAKRCICPWNR